MPEPQEDIGSKSEKTSKILEFFNRKVKDTKKELPLTRIVIRRLPPRLTKEELLNQITLPPHDSFYFVRGDLSLGMQSFSRAYLNFHNTEEIYGFKEKYDDLPFIDDQGKEYHAVVEWAPVQRLRKKGSLQKLTNCGTLETDPKYTEFLEKLEKEKNNAGNPSEYFMETDNMPLKEAKVTTTPLLEFLKLKRQQKIDLRNEQKLRKKEAEKERRRKEDEIRRVEKIKRVKEKEKKKLDVEEKPGKVEEATNEHDRDNTSKEKDDSKNSDGRERKFDSKSPRPIKIEKPDFKSSIRRDDKHDKSGKGFGKADIIIKPSKSFEKTIDSGNSKQKKELIEEKKNYKFNQPERKTFSTSKIDDSTIKPFITKPLNDKRASQEPEKKEETKSKFRYSEQRNRDRGVRNQKTVSKVDIDAVKVEPPAVVSELKKETSEVDEETRGRIRRQSTQETSDGSVDGDEVKPSGGRKTSSGRKDPRTERRIRNKDRPSIEIYRPGMGKFSKQRLEQKKEDSDVIEVKKDDTEYKKSNSKFRKERKKDEYKNEKTLKTDDIDVIEAGSCKGNVDGLEEEEREGKSKEYMGNIALTEVQTDIIDSKYDEAIMNESKQSVTTETVKDQTKVESNTRQDQPKAENNTGQDQPTAENKTMRQDLLRTENETRVDRQDQSKDQNETRLDLGHNIKSSDENECEAKTPTNDNIVDEVEVVTKTEKKIDENKEEELVDDLNS